MEDVHTSAYDEPVQSPRFAPDPIWFKYPILYKFPIKDGKYAQKTVLPWLPGILAVYHLTNRLLMAPEIYVFPNYMLRRDAHSPDERQEEEPHLHIVEIRKHQPILKPLNTDLSAAKEHFTHVFLISPQLLLATSAKKFFPKAFLNRFTLDKLTCPARKDVMLRNIDWFVEEFRNDVGILEFVVFFTESTDHLDCNPRTVPTVAVVVRGGWVPLRDKWRTVCVSTAARHMIAPAPPGGNGLVDDEL